MRRTNTPLVRWVASVFLVLFLLPVIQLNVERVAEKNGWDRILTEKAGEMAWLYQIAESGLFLTLIGFLAGVCTVLWVDYLYFYCQFAPNSRPLSKREKSERLGRTLEYHCKKTLCDLFRKRSFSKFSDLECIEIMFKFASVTARLRELGIATIKSSDFHTKDEKLVAFATYFALIKEYLKAGQLREAKRCAKSSVLELTQNYADSSQHRLCG